MSSAQVLRRIFSVSVNQRLEEECHEPPFVFVREGKFSFHMTHALRNPDREIGSRLYGKFLQLTRMMDIYTRVVSSMHNIDGAVSVVSNGIFGTESGEIIPGNHVCHEDSTRRKKCRIIITRQLFVGDLRQIRIGRVYERGCQTRFLRESNQCRTCPQGLSIDADVVWGELFLTNQPVPGSEQILIFIIANCRATIFNIRFAVLAHIVHQHVKSISMQHSGNDQYSGIAFATVKSMRQNDCRGVSLASNEPARQIELRLSTGKRDCLKFRYEIRLDFK